MELVLACGLVSMAACEATPGPGEGPRRPNLIVILADDAGYSDFGFQDHATEDVGPLTPNIDSIAAAGARLTDFYVSGCVCSPSRAGLLTGRYQQRFGHEQNLPVGFKHGGLPLTESTLADRLLDAGYATACVGKWHLGYPDDYHPNERGFEHFYGCLQGSRSYFPYEKPTPYRVLLENRTPTPEEGYVTDRLGAAAVRFVREHAHEPFFLYLSFTAPHGPLEAKEEDLALPALARIQKNKRRAYAGLIKAMDDSVGALLAALEEEGIARDTLVVFTNDNGGQTQTKAVNAPLRGRKGTLFEGGIRVPCAVRWPGRVAPGTVIDAPTISLDLTPTFLSAAGVAVDDPLLDGVDLIPLLTGGDPPSERSLYWRHKGPHGLLALRRGRWKLLWKDRTAEPELFDLLTDLEETEDVAAAHPSLAAELFASARAWEGELAEPLWGSLTPAPE